MLFFLGLSYGFTSMERARVLDDFQPVVLMVNRSLDNYAIKLEDNNSASLMRPTLSKLTLDSLEAQSFRIYQVGMSKAFFLGLDEIPEIKLVDSQDELHGTRVPSAIGRMGMYEIKTALSEPNGLVFFNIRNPKGECLSVIGTQEDPQYDVGFQKCRKGNSRQEWSFTSKAKGLCFLDAESCHNAKQILKAEESVKNRIYELLVRIKKPISYE